MRCIIASWKKSLLFSALLHVGIVAISAVLFDTKPSAVLNSSTPPKPIQAISSYLVQLPEKPEVVVSTPTATPTETPIATSPSTLTQTTEKNKETPTEIVDAEESIDENPPNETKENKIVSTLKSDPQDPNSSIEKPENDCQKGNPSLQSILEATRNYIQTQTPQSSLESIQAAAKNTSKTNRPDMDSQRFAPKGSGIKVIGVATHGALQVKFNSICFSIETDQWRDLLWVPTPCPRSADDTQRILNQSLKKYGLK